MDNESLVQLERKLEIKKNILLRSKKDLLSYQKEYKDEEASLLKLKHTTTEPVCPHVISKQKEVLKETEAMIANSSKRVVSASQELKEMLESMPKELENSIKECNHLLSTLAPLPILQ